MTSIALDHLGLVEQLDLLLDVVAHVWVRVPRLVGRFSHRVEEDQGVDPLVTDPARVVLALEHLPLAWAATHFILEAIEPGQDTSS